MPKLVEVVDQFKRSIPLHVAAATTRLFPREERLVKALLDVNPNMCFARDKDGMTPFHVAAVNGNIEVLKMFLKRRRPAALERTTRGETILHLCVTNRQLGTLEALVVLTYDLELLNSGDSDGNTVLHLAVIYRELQMVRFLLELRHMIDKNAKNKNNKTIRDIFDHVKRKNETDDDEEIENLFIFHNVLRSSKPKTVDEKWLEQQNTALMVVATCIATFSFQVGITPPGGIWQDENGHKAETPIPDGKDHYLYKCVQISNTVGLMSSLGVVLLLISGLPCTRLLVFVLRFTLWIAVMASAATYFYTTGFLTSDFVNKDIVQDALDYSIEIWLWLMLLVLLGYHCVRPALLCAARFIWIHTGYQFRVKIRRFLQKIGCNCVELNVFD